MILNDAIIAQAAVVDAHTVAVEKAVSALHPVTSWVFFGDSVTDNWFHVAEQVPAGSINSGTPGNTTGVMLAFFQARVLDHHAGGMVIAGGINDINGVDGPGIFPTADEIAGNLIQMADMALAAGMKVVMCSILPLGVFAFHPPDRMLRITRVNSAIAAYAENQPRVVYCDYYSAIAGPDGVMPLEFSPDGIHPNAEGYSAMLVPLESAMHNVQSGT